MSDVLNEAPKAVSKYDQLIAAAREVEPPRTVVVHPCDETSLRGAVEAAEAGLIEPVLVGPAAKIRAVAARAPHRPRRLRDRRRRRTATTPPRARWR